MTSYTFQLIIITLFVVAVAANLVLNRIIKATQSRRETDKGYVVWLKRIGGNND